MMLLWTVALTHLVALMSPGPDFVLVVRNALGKSRRDGYMTALGFAAGVAVHLTWGILGLGLLMTELPWLQTLLQYVGAGYLAYIGLKSWNAGQFQIAASTEAKRSNYMTSFREGFITNLLNVKAMLFFISLIVNVLTPEVTVSVRISAALLMVTLTALWFILVSRFLTISSIQRAFLAAQRPIEKLLALILWALALKLSGILEVIARLLA
ncbi:MAG: LysE family transporter [Bacteriovoracia bacterium]